MSTSIPLQDARQVVDAALAECQRRGFDAAAAVVDERGDLIIVVRLDGARHYYADAALGKAMCAAIWQDTSRAIAQRADHASVHERVNRLNGGRIVFAPGAVPLSRRGRVVGAIGVGGAGPDIDEEIATAAAQAFAP
jgi:uncharacterized protein GlcG (DUF336 family)